jgi:hypothetical protein
VVRVRKFVTVDTVEGQFVLLLLLLFSFLFPLFIIATRPDAHKHAHCNFRFIIESIVQLQSRKKYMADQVYNDNGDATITSNDDDGGGTAARLNLDDFKLIFRKEE